MSRFAYRLGILLSLGGLIALHAPAALAAAVRLEETVLDDGGIAVSLHYMQDDGEDPAGLQFDLQYDNHAYALSEVVEGNVALDAGKDVVYSEPYGDTARVMVLGFGPENLGEGVVATLYFYPVDNADTQALVPRLDNLVASDAQGGTVDLALFEDASQEPKELDPEADGADAPATTDAAEAIASPDATASTVSGAGIHELTGNTRQKTVNLSGKKTRSTRQRFDSGHYPTSRGNSVMKPRRQRPGDAPLPRNTFSRRPDGAPRNVTTTGGRFGPEPAGTTGRSGEWPSSNAIRVASLMPDPSPGMSNNRQPLDLPPAVTLLPRQMGNRPDMQVFQFLLAALAFAAIFGIRRLFFPAG